MPVVGVARDAWMVEIDRLRRPIGRQDHMAAAWGGLRLYRFEGVDAVVNVRRMVGETEPKAALPGTIRGDYAHISYNYADNKGIAVPNLVHASGNKEEAEKEISLWFSQEELFSYKSVHDKHLI